MTASPLVGVLALQGDVREHSRVLSDLGAQVRRVRAPEDVAGLSGLVLPGGESTTISQLAVRWGLIDVVHAALASGLPAFGTCAGLILLANDITDAKVGQRSFGGLDITARRNAFGRQVDSFEQDLRIPVLGTTPFPGVFIRAPAVERVGSNVDVLALIEGGPTAGRIVAVQQEVLLATAFHPELTPDTRMHEHFLAMLRQA